VVVSSILDSRVHVVEDLLAALQHPLQTCELGLVAQLQQILKQQWIFGQPLKPKRYDILEINLLIPDSLQNSNLRRYL
jgi:hypothetical protein